MKIDLIITHSPGAGHVARPAKVGRLHLVHDAAHVEHHVAGLALFQRRSEDGRKIVELQFVIEFRSRTPIF